MVDISNKRGWDNVNGDKECRKDKGVIEGSYRSFGLNHKPSKYKLG